MRPPQPPSRVAASPSQRVQSSATSSLRMSRHQVLEAVCRWPKRPVRPGHRSRYHASDPSGFAHAVDAGEDVREDAHDHETIIAARGEIMVLRAQTPLPPRVRGTSPIGGWKCPALKRPSMPAPTDHEIGRSIRSRLILLVPVLLTFAGCMVGPNYQRPKVSVSPSFGETGDPRLSAESTNYRDWWKAFNDPVLDRIVARAYRDNLTLQQAGVRVLQARAQLGIAVGEIFPQTQQAIGSVQYNRTSERAATAALFNGGGGSIAYWQSQIGAQANWELDFWGRIRRGIQSADASLLATLADYDNTLVTLTADVANTYIALRTAEERIRIALENIDIQEQTLKIVEARFTYGTVTQLDVEQARTALFNTRATLPVFETQRRQARDALSVLLGMPPNDLSDLLSGPSTIPVSPPLVIVGIPADLLRRRPDIRSAELQAVAQSAQIGVAKADLLPAFSLIGSLVLVSTDLGT